MVGLDAGGKTTILYRLKLGEVVTTIPTIGFLTMMNLSNLAGFNVEEIPYEDYRLTIWYSNNIVMFV